MNKTEIICMAAMAFVIAPLPAFGTYRETSSTNSEYIIPGLTDRVSRRNTSNTNRLKDEKFVHSTITEQMNGNKQYTNKPSLTARRNYNNNIGAKNYKRSYR